MNRQTRIADEFGDLLVPQAAPRRASQPQKRRTFRPASPPPAQRITAFAGALGALLIFGLGGWLWYQGALKQGHADTSAHVAGLLQDKPLPPDQRTIYEGLYSEASADFSQGKLADAAVRLSVIVKDAPGFKGNAAAFLLMCYRGQALAQMDDAGSGDAALGTLDQALRLVDLYQDGLRDQFKQNPTLLPENFADFDAIAADLRLQKGWFETYRQAESAQIAAKEDWYDSAIPQWQTVYGANKNFLRERTDRWVATRLLDAYDAQATAYCNKKDANKASAAWITARSITVETDQQGRRDQIDRALATLNEGACQALTPNG